jgi:hypothetical protein
MFSVHPIEIYRPCSPSPCGANALCNERDGAGSCTCMKNFFGDPYISCRPECIQNSDCDRSKACENTKCVDPCIGSCGLNAECRVLFHTPQCHCKYGYTGDATQICYTVAISKFRQTSHRRLCTTSASSPICRKRRTTTSTPEPLSSFAMWTEQHLSHLRWPSRLLVSSQLLWRASKLPC